MAAPGHPRSSGSSFSLTRLKPYPMAGRLCVSGMAHTSTTEWLRSMRVVDPGSSAMASYLNTLGGAGYLCRRYRRGARPPPHGAGGASDAGAPPMLLTRTSVSMYSHSHGTAAGRLYTRVGGVAAAAARGVH
jgi:hypothetical protein